MNSPETNDKPEGIRKPLFRGVWADYLKNGDTLPVGGQNIASDKMTKGLSLDFSTFEDQLDKFNKANIEKLYEKAEPDIQKWLEEAGSKVDPYTYFLCHLVQKKVEELLAVDPNGKIAEAARTKMYNHDKPPKLSDLSGFAACAEQAALAQHLFQRVDFSSTYMSGICMKDAHSSSEFPHDHSFLILNENPEKTLIFDIARPRRSQHNVPRVLETDQPMTFEQFQGKKDFLVGATEVLQGSRLWFGVGRPTAGNHNIAA